VKEIKKRDIKEEPEHKEERSIERHIFYVLYILIYLINIIM
jgi:hypothetical protein